MALIYGKASGSMPMLMSTQGEKQNVKYKVSATWIEPHQKLLTTDFTTAVLTLTMATIADTTSAAYTTAADNNIVKSLQLCGCYYLDKILLSSLMLLQNCFIYCYYYLFSYCYN